MIHGSWSQKLRECLYLVKRISYLANKEYNAPSFRPALHARLVESKRASRDTRCEEQRAIVAEVLVSLTDYRERFRGFSVFACEAASP
jgi:hypothetical protein